jgi:hypothetical protein
MRTEHQKKREAGDREESRRLEYKDQRVGDGGGDRVFAGFSLSPGMRLTRAEAGSYWKR